MFNISEPAPMYVAGLLAVFWGVAQLLPAQTLYGLERYTVLRPLGVDALSTQGLTLLGHALAHGDFMHLAMNSLFIMIFGVAIVRAARIRGRRGDRPGRAVSVFLLLFILGVVGGGLAQWVEWAMTGEINVAAVGASGGASALMAAAGFVMGGRGLMLRFGAAWAVINVVMVMSAGLTGAPIAWAAHLGGFVTGMLIAPSLLAIRHGA